MGGAGESFFIGSGLLPVNGFDQQGSNFDGIYVFFNNCCGGSVEGGSEREEETPISC